MLSERKILLESHSRQGLGASLYSLTPLSSAYRTKNIKAQISFLHKCSEIIILIIMTVYFQHFCIVHLDLEKLPNYKIIVVPLLSTISKL